MKWRSEVVAYQAHLRARLAFPRLAFVLRYAAIGDVAFRVDRQDPRFIEIAARNLPLYEGLTMDDLREALQPDFELVTQLDVDQNLRKLTLWRRRGA